ncbi:MAG TPA: hypothetical protein PK020_09570 [Ilumatobacteraceae bacterium]|nr:hypothetical protein [Ilumatobacteraceae bacterium]
MLDPVPPNSPRDDSFTPYVLGGGLRVRWSTRSAAALAMICAVVALPLRGLFVAPASSMEEGFMLAFPQRIARGEVPNLDFLHLYGPFSLHVLTGWYQLFGDTLASQRAFGLVQHLGIIFAIYALTRAWGRRVAVICAVTMTMLALTPIGLAALSWEGGVALGLWSVVYGLRALHTSGPTRTRALIICGVLIGFALGYRPDLVLALALVHGWLLWQRRSERTWKPLAVGAAIGVVPLVVHLVMAGVGPSFRGMFLDPVFALRPGRELPAPPDLNEFGGALQGLSEGADSPWWRFPSLSGTHQLFVWFFLVVVVAVGLPIATWRLRRSTRPPVARQTVLFAVALIGLGTLPQALQRPDSTHLAWGSYISFAVVPCLVVELLALRSPRIAPHAWLAAGAAVAVTMFLVNPFYTYRPYLFQSRVSVGNKPGGFEIVRDDHNFYFSNEALRAASQAAIDDLDARSQPGQRLLVGPADLRRTIYNDVSFYALFPDLVPATYYIEMDPGLADQEGSGLAQDVASADWLILTNFWTGWYEPNASSNFGSDEPNQVVADDFCLVGNYDNALVLLYQRCDHGDGVSPAGIGVGVQRRADFEREKARRGGH